MLKWYLYLPARIVLTPLIWWNQEQRKWGMKPDEWYWADRWLVERGHCVSQIPDKLDKLCRIFIRCFDIIGTALIAAFLFALLFLDWSV